MEICVQHAYEEARMSANPNLTKAITCPRCKGKLPVRIEDLKPGKAVNCPNCHAVIRFER